MVCRVRSAAHAGRHAPQGHQSSSRLGRGVVSEWRKECAQGRGRAAARARVRLMPRMAYTGSRPNKKMQTTLASTRQTLAT